MVSDRSSQHPRWRALLLQPTWLAGVISVGFHGVLFAAGPTFSNLNLDTLADPDALATSRRVPLVELTLEEQQRHLPDFSNSFYSLSSLEDFETTTLPRTPVPSLSKDNASTRSPQSRTTITDQVTTLGTIPFRSRLPGIRSAPTGGTSDRPAQTPTPDQTTTATPGTDSTTATAPADSSSTESSAEDLALAPNNPTEASSGNTAGQPPVVDLPQIFAYDSNNLEEAWGRWVDQLELAPLEQSLPAEPLPLAYRPSRQSACSNIDQAGLVAALVTGEGKLIEDSVELLKSTGNPGLDTWAQADGIQAWANEYKFPEISQPQTAYLLEVFIEGLASCN